MNRSLEDRKAQSENGKENINVDQKDDRELYRYFTNSARDTNNLRNVRYHDYHELSDDELLSTLLAVCTDQYCERCQAKRDNVPACNFCKQRRFLTRKQSGDIGRDEQQFVCLQCHHEPICVKCRKEICSRCKQPTDRSEESCKLKTKLNKKHAMESQKKINTKLLKKRASHDESIPESDSDGELFEKLSIASSPKAFRQSDHGKPYSFNIDKNSLFHPSNTSLGANLRNDGVSLDSNVHDDFDELKRLTDEKLSKYARNYSELRTRMSSRNKLFDDDANFHMPIIAENGKTIFAFGHEFAPPLDSHRSSAALKPSGQVRMCI